MLQNPYHIFFNLRYNDSVYKDIIQNIYNGLL